jgi:hypothetical protein
MADHSGSDPLSFESALQAYQKKTGITLAQHPIAVNLQSCHSVEEITTPFCKAEHRPSVVFEKGLK